MGGVINLIKNLFGGIFSFIGGILGGKKSSRYYMEWDEAKSAIAEPAKAVKKAAAPVAAAIAEVTKSEPEKPEAPKAESAKAEAPKAKPEKAEAPKAKSEKAKAKKAPAEPATADLNGSTNGAKPPVPANTLNLPQPTVSFATEHLVPKPTNSRRRPGANMGSFLEMAKTVKTPNN